MGLGSGALLEWLHLNKSVVASVNGEPIRAGDLNHNLQIAAGNTVLRQMVADDLRLQFAAQQHALPSDATIDTEIARAQTQAGFTQRLLASYQNIDDIRHSLLVNEAQATPLEQGVTISEADAQAYYRHNIDPANPHSLFYQPDTVQVAAIVTANESQAYAAYHDLASGYSFASVARAYSIDRSGQTNGGLLPPFQKGRSQMSAFPGLASLVFSMSPDRQSNVTRIGKTWWIVRCVGIAPERTVPYSQVADECRDGALLAKGLELNGAKVQAELATFQANASIKILWPDYKAALGGHY